MKDVCAWAAVNDEMWVQFAEQLGDASLQNISLVAAMQPADIKEAIEAAITGVVASGSASRASVCWAAWWRRRRSTHSESQSRTCAGSSV